MVIKRSYHFYFIILPFGNFKPNLFFSDSYFDYIFNYSPFPKYMEQGICDILPSENGILFTQIVLQQFESAQLMNDFQACFAFNLPTEICDKEQYRYKKDYTFDFDIEAFKNEVSMELILQYEESPWKPILSIDPDFFYLRGEQQLLIGSKDYKQVENWIKEINTANNK